MVFCNLGMLIHQRKQAKCHNPYFSRWFSAILAEFKEYYIPLIVTILILVDGFLQSCTVTATVFCGEFVTILILVDGFLQSFKYFNGNNTDKCHNPYFSRWFSAIVLVDRVKTF